MADDCTNFYDALAAHHHLLFADWPAAIAAHGAVLDRVIRAAGATGATLLDCACGIGTQALGLAARGYRVTGSDLSPAALARARREAAARGLEIDFRAADMRSLATSVPAGFDVVVAADNALADLIDDDDKSGTTNRGQYTIIRISYNYILSPICCPRIVRPVRCRGRFRRRGGCS